MFEKEMTNMSDWGRTFFYTVYIARTFKVVAQLSRSQNGGVAKLRCSEFSTTVSCKVFAGDRKNYQVIIYQELIGREQSGFRIESIELLRWFANEEKEGVGEKCRKQSEIQCVAL